MKMQLQMFCLIRKLTHFARRAAKVCVCAKKWSTMRWEMTKNYFVCPVLAHKTSVVQPNSSLICANIFLDVNVLPKNGRSILSGRFVHVLPVVSSRFVLEIKMADFSLDLRGVACPINFVKTRLFLDKINSGQSLEVWLDDGEPIESVTSSIAAEGHSILSSEQDSSGFHKLCLVKA